MVSQVLIRLPKTAVGFDLLLLELFLDPITQGFHHRTALGLMIFESRALTHSSGKFSSISLNFPRPCARQLRSTVGIFFFPLTAAASDIFIGVPKAGFRFFNKSSRFSPACLRPLW